MLRRERVVAGKGFVGCWGVLVGLIRVDLTDLSGGRVVAGVIGNLSSFSSD